MAGTARALVVQNTATGGPGRWEGWLGEGGLALEVVRAFAGEALPERLRPRYQALVVLGGGFLPDDDERAPWLARTRELAREAVEFGLPVFGICLGGQLLAQVAGGAVRGEHGRPEFGSTELTLRQEAAEDPLFAGLPVRPRAIENHVDAITELPPGAAWLASTEGCPYQAFRLGESAWGVQFHPEAEAERIGGWDLDRLTRHGADRAALHREALAADADSARVWREVALRFAARAVAAA
ncbi:GMP synthase-Glutamine amidotransferase [Actinacidiphila yanglinensis]|uniref:GMP synthase-Glutamine amidotransferase n=1 Tax=Actinacidiphila yanglinensis TaxID=310779 RepID=A0A1H5VN60_9ACTN|nr:type 1 glutamine amidotransferase [Actinacidiphila yanglinensis]SEF88308.1 GMP synthase-Glutamine amidotransferase [Actinacidiphila yanglinensis]